MPRMLDINRVCSSLSEPPLHPSTVYRMVIRNELKPPVRIGVRSARWPEDEIEDYKARRADPSERQLLPVHPETARKRRERDAARKDNPTRGEAINPLEKKSHDDERH